MYLARTRLATLVLVSTLLGLSWMATAGAQSGDAVYASNREFEFRARPFCASEWNAARASWRVPDAPPLRDGLGHTGTYGFTALQQTDAVALEQTIQSRTTSGYYNDPTDQYLTCLFRYRLTELRGGPSHPAASAAPARPPSAAAVALPSARSEQELSDQTVRPPAGTRGDWDPAAMKEGEEALEEVLNPSAARAPQAAPASQRVIARDGQVATCVSIETISTGDSTLAGGGRVLVNNCSDTVEIGWCTRGGECERGLGNQWDVQPGRSWPVPLEKQIRWGACHGANTFHGDPGAQGAAFTCSAPQGSPPSSAVPTGAGRSNEN
jgi:hypothetical protein